MIRYNPNENNKCIDFSIYYYDYMFEGKDIIPATALEHFLSCQHCKAEMELLKTEMETCCGATDEQILSAIRAESLKLHFSFISKYVSCNEARQLLPTMMSSKAIRTPTPITVHVSNCPSCLADYNTLQKMNLPEKNLFKIGKLLADETVRSNSEVEIGVKIFQAVSDIQCEKSIIDELVEIVCRPASGVKTLFNLKDEIDQENISIGDENQIEVSVFNDNEAPKAKSEPESNKKPSANFNFSKFLKPIAAAAVLIVAFILFKGPTATADYDLIYKALENIKNVHLKITGIGKIETSQYIWISRELNVKVVKSGSKVNIWDIGKKLKISKDTADGTVATNKMDTDLIQQISQTMQVPWSLLPFKSISNLPEGATWQILENDILDGKSTNEVYEILWAEKLIPSGEILTKWRGTIDRKTSLPKRTEWWEKTSSQKEYILKTVTEIGYPSSKEISGVVGKLK